MLEISPYVSDRKRVGPGGHNNVTNRHDGRGDTQHGPDEILKNSMANFAFEHFEIAAYTSLIIAASRSGGSAAISLEQSLDQEQRMADMIKQMPLPNVTECYIRPKASGDTAGV